MYNKEICREGEGSYYCKEKKAKGKCDWSCHSKGCQCGKCPTDNCNIKEHPKGCHCGGRPLNTKTFC